MFITALYGGGIHMSSARARATKTLCVIGVALLMVWSTVLVFSAAAAEERDVYLVSLDNNTSPEVFRTNGMKVLVDYGSGVYITQATESQALWMNRQDVDIVHLKNIRTLDLYPSDVIFDTTKGIPSTPDVMKGFNWDKETYVVQFVGPYSADWIESIENMGARVGKLVPVFSLVAKMAPDVKSKVSNLPYVAWVGEYKPSYKVSSELLNAEGTIRVAIMTYEDSQRQGLARKLVDMGASVLMTYSPGTVVAYLDSELLSWAVSFPEVMQVFRDYVPTTQDIVANKIHGSFEAWYPARSGLPSALTGRSPGPDGIDHTGDDYYEVIGIQDSGFDNSDADQGHPDYFMGPNGDRVIRYVDQSGFSHPDGWQTGTPHGTHVAGTAMANGFAWEYANSLPTDDDDWEYADGAGQAPEAKLSIDGVQRFGQGLLANPAYWDFQYADGAYVNSNSYGSPPADYQGDAWVVDQKTAQDNNRLIVFAASNEGPDPNTLSSNTQGKNGLSAGASLNFRPEWFEADNPNLIAWYSSRGGNLQSYGRLKPDMVTVGTASIAPYGYGGWLHNEATGKGNPQPECIVEVDVYNYNNPLALDGDGICDYMYMGGTSTASPQMAGGALLVREYLREIAGISDPTLINSYLVKALMINGAVRMDEALYEYPGYDQGWGRVDLRQSLFPPVPRTNRWEEGLVTFVGESQTPSFGKSLHSDGVPLKVTLVWVDTPNKALNRDLNLVMTSPGGDIYRGNVYGTIGQFDGWSLPNPSDTDIFPDWDRNGDGYDDVNNVEQIEVEFPETGAWQIEVRGFSIPSAVPYAIVVGADFGPQNEFKIDLDTDHPLSLEATQDGEVFFPFTVTNFGTSVDNVYLDSTRPPGINVDFEFAPPVLWGLESRETVSTYATISIDSMVIPGCYDVKLVGQSLSDMDVTDQLELTVCVPDEKVVTPIQLTFSTVDELDPSVLTFNDGTDDHIFIAYRKTTAVRDNGRKGGVNVWVANTTLDTEGMPILPFTYSEVSDFNDDPNDLRFTIIPSGTYQNRIILTWTGDDVDASNEDLDSYGVLSYSDPPYNTWTRVIIEQNAGSSMMNEARVNIPLWRYDGTAAGEVIWVWEHLDYSNPDATNPLRVQTWVAISRDGGQTWPVCDGLDPDCRRISPYDNNFYFFPNACMDMNERLWVFFYYRLPAGNDRDLMVRLYDEFGWQGDSTPMDSKDDVSLLWNTKNTNLQWPTCVATPEGLSGNRMYVVVTNDQGAVDLKLFVSYLDGNYTSIDRPFGLNTTEEQGISPNLHGPYGPMGTSVSNANYDRRPITNMVYTNDGWTWIQYIENANKFDAPNLDTFSSKEGFLNASVQEHSVLTANSHAKGHQMTDTLTVSGIHHNVYEVFHMSKGTETEVNYDVYLLVYHKGWESDPDTIGPVVDPVVAIPNPFDVSVEGRELSLYASVSDVTTGMSDVKAAQWKEVSLAVTDPRMIDWTVNVSSMAIGTESPTETGLATFIPSTWDGLETHRLCARGQDFYDNWGIGSCVDVTTIGKKPVFAMYDLDFTTTGWHLISIPLTVTDNSIGYVFQSIIGNFDELRVYDATTGQWLSYQTYKSWQTLTEVDKTMGIWIHITSAPCTLHVEGNLTYITEIPLQPGWNLVGYPSLNATGMTVGDLMSDPKLFIERVEGFAGLNSPYYLKLLDPSDPSAYLQPGAGYWVYVDSTQGRNWEVPGGY
jgi:hypothetical protein